MAANNPQTQTLEDANEQPQHRSPVLWGRKERLERIGLTVMAGKLWFHVFIGGQRVASIPVEPREIAKLGEIGRVALAVAEQQNEDYQRELADRDGAFGFGR